MNDYDDRQIILHIGYPKAASSFLKRDFFAPAAGNLIVPRGRQLDLLRNAKDAMQIRRMILSDVAESNLPTVVSNENLVGRSFWDLGGASAVCDNWHEAFPDSKIVIVIREQRDYVVSAYKYAVYTGHYLPRIEAFLSANKLQVLEKVRYHAIIEAYQHRFGADNVCVLPVEMFARDEAGFYDRLVRFTGVQKAVAPRSTVHNRSPASWRYIELLRRANFGLRYVASAERAVRRLRQGDRLDEGAHRIVLYRAIVDPLARFCAQSCFEGQLFSPTEEALIAESNRITSDLISLPLQDYGYL